jgi:phospholipid transport system substrate-binding protein
MIYFKVIKPILSMALFSLLAFSHVSFAQLSPHQVIEAKTTEVISLIKKGKTTYKTKPTAFFQEVEHSLDGILDFRLFARNVMGSYGSAKTYSTFTPAQKKQFNTRLDRFSRSFKKSLISKYGLALLLFEGQKIEVAPPSEAAKKNIKQLKPIKVFQYFYNDKKERYTIEYIMKVNSKNKWMIRNIIVQPNINIGKIYRRQFATSMKKHNNIDKVIDIWSVDAPIASSTKESVKKRLTK